MQLSRSAAALHSAPLDSAQSRKDFRRPILSLRPLDTRASSTATPLLQSDCRAPYLSPTTAGLTPHPAEPTSPTLRPLSSPLLFFNEWWAVIDLLTNYKNDNPNNPIARLITLIELVPRRWSDSAAHNPTDRASPTLPYLPLSSALI